MSNNDVVLTYFQGRGRAEIIRIVLNLANISFRDVFVHTHEELQKLRAEKKLFFQQLPLVEMDGMCLNQTHCIVRYIGEKSGLVPKDPKLKFKADLLFEGARDAYMPYMAMNWGRMGPDEEVLNAQKCLDRYLPIFDKELESNASGYLVGDSCTIADAGLLEFLLATVDYFSEAAFDKYNNIQKFLHFMKSKPEVMTYIKRDRQRPNDDKYVAEVKQVLQR